jgi:hypothetical protein
MTERIDNNETSQSQQAARPVLEYATPVRVVKNPAATASAVLAWISLLWIPVMCAGMEGRGGFGPAMGLAWVSALLLAVVFGHIGRGRSRQLNGCGKDLALQGLVLGYGMLVLGIAASIVVPQTGRAREPANRVKCQANLKTIGLGIKLYVEQYGKYPADLGEVMVTQDVSAWAFVCPSAPGATEAQGATKQEMLADFAKPGRCSYVYLGAGFSSSTPSNAVLAYEDPANHDGNGANLLYKDLHAEWRTGPDLQTVIQELRAGKNPPPSWNGAGQ